MNTNPNPQRDAINAVVLALHDALKVALERTTEAVETIGEQNQYGTIGALDGLESALNAAIALHGAAVALNRVKRS